MIINYVLFIIMGLIIFLVDQILILNQGCHRSILLIIIVIFELFIGIIPLSHLLSINFEYPRAGVCPFSY